MLLEFWEHCFFPQVNLLSHYTEGVFVEILTIIGWVAIWEATGGVILKRPELYHFRKKYDLALKTEIIIDVLPRD